MKMQNNAGLELTTTAEAADDLRIKGRKLYELVAEGATGCAKVTGKRLFPRRDLDRWLLAGMARPFGVISANPPPVVGGSHDPLRLWTLSESWSGFAILPEGSQNGYRRFLAGEVLAAAIHFHDLDDQAKDANVEIVAKEPTLYDAVLIGFPSRKQDLLTAAGSPLGLGGLAGAVSQVARVAFRPDGAVVQQLLLALLKRDDIPLATVQQAMFPIPCACRGAHLKPVGERNAGDPHVAFDERGAEKE